MTADQLMAIAMAFGLISFVVFAFVQGGKVQPLGHMAEPCLAASECVWRNALFRRTKATTRLADRGQGDPS
jgi:hypothetical protein